MNGKYYKVTLLVVLLITLMVTYTFAYEGDTELNYDKDGRIIIDKETADTLILENSTAYKSLQAQMLDLQNVESGLSYTQKIPTGVDSSGVIYGDLSEAYAVYSSLMYKEANGYITPFEEATLDVLKGIFGEVDYDYLDYQDEAYNAQEDKTREDYFNLIYLPMVQYENTKAAVDVLQNQLLVINDQVLNGNYQLMASYNNLSELQKVQQEELLLASKLLEEERNKLELGKISEISFKNSEIDYQIKVQTQQNLVRTVNNLYLNIQKNLGLSMDDQIMIEDFWLDEPMVKLDNYQVYLEQAMENRIEIKNAQIEYEAQKTNYDYYVRAYGRNHSESVNQRKKMNDALYNIDKAKLDVQKDIYYGYHDIGNKIKTFEISELKYQNALNSYETAKASYEAGIITELNYRLAKYGFDMANVAHKNDYRQLQMAMNQFEEASNQGPKYQSLESSNTTN